MPLKSHQFRVQWRSEYWIVSFNFSIFPDAGPVRAPVPASHVMMENLRKLAGISSESTDTKELAVVAFLYLFNSITPING